MIMVCLSHLVATHFDIHSDTEGEIEFVVVALNAVCPDIIDRWQFNGDNPTFDSPEFDRWEIVWCIDDEEGWPLAHKIYNYIKDFGFDVEIVEEKA